MYNLTKAMDILNVESLHEEEFLQWQYFDDATGEELRSSMQRT